MPFAGVLPLTGGVMQGMGSVLAMLLALLLSVYPGPLAAIEVGEKAPDFELPSTKEGKFKLSGLAGKKNVIIQFYVLDFTPT